MLWIAALLSLVSVALSYYLLATIRTYVLYRKARNQHESWVCPGCNGVFKIRLNHIKTRKEVILVDPAPGMSGRKMHNKTELVAELTCPFCQTVRVYRWNELI